MMLYSVQRTFKFILTGKSHNTQQGREFRVITPRLQVQEVILQEVRKFWQNKTEVLRVDST